MASTDAIEEEYMKGAIELVKEAGYMVRDAFNKPRTVKTKASAVDLVTETDKKVEELLFSGLAKKFPSHKFIGEESASEGVKTVFSDDPTWIIDPIDGTTNFVHRLPFVGICVGLAIKKKLRGGIVYNPILDELYTARVGKGAYKNGFPIHVSGTKDIGKSIYTGSFGIHNIPIVGIDRTLEVAKANFTAMISAGIRGTRQFGSAALNMTYIAEGAADSYVEYGLHCWDFAASAVILTEAGGVVMDPTGSELDVMGRRILCASSAELARAISPKLTHIEYQRECQ